MSAKAENNNNNSNGQRGDKNGSNRDSHAHVSSSASLFGMPSPNNAGVEKDNSNKGQGQLSPNLLSSLFGAFDEADVRTFMQTSFD